MNIFFIATLLVAILQLNLLCAEPAAFGAGKLNDSNPYGLTQTEEHILQNKRKLKKITTTSNNQANEVDSLRERLDGMQSIVEGLSRKSHKNSLSFKSLEQKNSKELENADEYEKRLSDISQNNSKEIENMKLVVSELSSILNNINENYISKVEFNTLVDDFNKFKILVVKELKQSGSTKKSVKKSMSNAQLAKLAKQNYDKKLYTKSIEQYNNLISKNYKPARSHYMIGEMYYYRKDYSNAIAYFKKSASLYSEASYMPTLMLHTAVSMQNSGDPSNAKSFYNAVISKYSGSKQAQIAENNLLNMQ